MINQTTLPTLDKLDAKVKPGVDIKKVASEWLESFTSHVRSGDVDNIVGLFVEDALFKDILALTWNFRTFEGTNTIGNFLRDCLPEAQLSSFKLKDEYLQLQQPYPDLAWIQALFEFETAVGLASGVFRLVPTSDGTWKAHTMFTTLENLKGFPEKTGSFRHIDPNPGKWEEKRKQEIKFEGKDPTVIIVGGSQSGLGIAARLKCLDVPTLVVERDPRVGDHWRKRYDTLCLHDPVWYNHMPYIPFPSSWPIFTPASKLGDWLESYAHSLDLNVWTSATAVKASQDPLTLRWSVTVKRNDGTERVLHPNHLVFATGIGGGIPKMPVHPGMDEFKGEVLHSSQYTKAMNHAGKKVVVVGACTSGHDICADCYEHGIDVTMLQRGPTYVMSMKEGPPRLFGALYSENGPPTDIADRMAASFPTKLTTLMHQRAVKCVAEADKEMLNGLTERGFKLTLGKDDAGLALLAQERVGGYYIDVGASQLIIDGKIKLKSDSPIERFTVTGVKFEDGSELPADAVIFATGYENLREAVRKLCGDEIGDKCKDLWGLDEEMEIKGVWRDSGVSNLWIMMGNLALCRFHSKHIALQIKAVEEKLFGTRYE